jgi:PAS domain S-box-containing protein
VEVPEPVSSSDDAPRTHVDDVARPVLSALLTAAVVVDEQGTITAANAGFERALGVRADAVVGARLMPLLQAVGREPSTVGALEAAIAAGRARRGEVLVQSDSGRRRWLHLSVEPLAAAPGHALVLMTSADEQMRALRAADRGHAALQAVVSLAERVVRAPHWQDVLYEALEELGRATHARAALAYRLEEDAYVLHAAWRFERDAASYPERFARGAWHEELAAEDVLQFDEFPNGAFAKHTDPEGRVALAAVRVSGAPWGVLAFDRSGTHQPWAPIDRLAFRAFGQTLAAGIERGVREEAVLAERTFARHVLDGVRDGVWVSDGADRILFANRVMHELLGLPDGALVGRGAAEIMDRLGAAEVTGDDASGNLEIAAEGGRTLLLRRVAHDFGDGSARAILAITDITRRRGLETELKQAAVRAESASAAKTRFLSRVSHELRTPLQVVMGYAHLVELDAAGSVAAEHATEITSAAAHLDRLVGDLLDLSGAEAGDLAVVFRTVDLSEQVREAVHALAPIALQAAVEVVMHVPEPVLVVADPGRVRQVLLNLLANAIKFAPARSVVYVTAAIDASGAYGEVFVRDQGPGFPEAELHRLFIPFERLSNAVGKNGSGLGLALSHVLAKRMGGVVTAANAPGGGARVGMMLPLAGTSSRT